MRRVLRSLGEKFEAIGYYAERAANRRREDFVTRQVRQMRWPVAVLAGLFGIALPIFRAINHLDARMLPAVPPAVAAIAVAYTSLGARTPNRRFGRMLVAVLLLALAMTVVALADQPWWPISG